MASNEEQEDLKRIEKKLDTLIDRVETIYFTFDKIGMREIVELVGWWKQVKQEKKRIEETQGEVKIEKVKLD